MAKKLVKDWLKSAYSDILLVKKIINDELLTHLAAFHSQQAIEKAIKALMLYNGDETPKIHKLQTLIDKVRFDLTDKEDELLQLLDKLYIDARYPGDLGLLPYGKPTLEDVMEFYEFALSFFRKVCKILNVSEEDLRI